MLRLTAKASARQNPAIQGSRTLRFTRWLPLQNSEESLNWVLQTRRHMRAGKWGFYSQKSEEWKK